MKAQFRTLMAATTATLLAISAPVDAQVAASKLSRPGSARPAMSPGFTTIITPMAEASFVPIAPCRLFDTSKTAKGPIAANTPRAFYVSTDASIGSQGGKSGGCGIPATATGVAMTLTTSTSSGVGSLLATPYSVPPQSSNTVVSYDATGSHTSSVNSQVVSGRVTLQAVAASTNVVGTTTGYFLPQMQAFIQANGTIYSATGRVFSVDHPSPGIYNITVDRDVYTCAMQVTHASMLGIASGFGDANNIIRVQLAVINSTGGYTLADDDFNLTGHC